MTHQDGLSSRGEQLGQAEGQAWEAPAEHSPSSHFPTERCVHPDELMITVME